MHPLSLATLVVLCPSIQQKSSSILSEHQPSPKVTPCVSVWRTILSLHRQGFSPGCCGSGSGSGSGCAVLTGYLPSCAGVTFIALHCGSCFTFHKYLKIHCMGELKLGLLPSEARCGNSCFELGSLVCSRWLLGRMIFSFPLLCTGFSECFMFQFCLWNMHLLEVTLNSDYVSVSPEEMREHITCVQIRVSFPGAICKPSGMNSGKSCTVTFCSRCCVFYSLHC